MENEMQFHKKKSGPSTVRSGSTGFYQTPTGSKGFQKPNLNLDPKKIIVNARFDDIPDVPSMDKTNKIPPKPKAIRQPLKKDSKEEKPLTDKLTNIAVDQKNMTSHNIERRIDRLHNEKKEITQKPNFGRYTPVSTEQPNPYV